MSRLAELFESREAAQTAYDEFVGPLLEAGEPLTDEQETERVTLRTRVEQFDARIDEIHAREQRDERLTQIRHEAGLDLPAQTDVKVTNEPTVYGEGSPHSYFADFCRASFAGYKGHRAAVARLEKAEHEAAVEMVRLEQKGTRKSLKRARHIAGLLADEFRSDERAAAMDAVRDYRSFGQTGWSQVAESRSGGARFMPDATLVETRRALLGEELRTGMTTGGSSGGSFVTPVYFVESYAPYRQFGRVFIDQTNKQPLPDYGVSVNLPHLTGPAGVAAQSPEGNPVTETDPTAGYITSALTTEAGQVTISQQLLDRAGPNFQFDVMVFDQLRRAYALQVDTFALTQALAGAGSVSYAGTVFNLVQPNGATSFYTRMGLAKKSTIDAAGTVLPATHAFMIPDRWEEIEGWTDANSRPIVLPTTAGPYNVAAWGNDGGPDVAEGFTGYKMRNLGVFEDGNIPTPGAGNDQCIIAHMQEVWTYEGDPVPRTIPQTFAQNLQVLLQLYSYITVIVRYPLAVQAISGTGMAAPTF